MAMKAIKDLYTTTTLLAPAAKNASWTSTALDFANAEENQIVLFPGLWTDGTHSFAINDSPDSTTWTTVSAANLVGTLNTITGTASATVQKFSYIGPNRYLQVVATLSGATTGMVTSLFAQTKPRKQVAP